MTEPAVILVTGDRAWSDRATVERVLGMIEHLTREPLGPGWRPTVLRHGAAPGLDTIAAEVAEVVCGWDTDPHPAEWRRYGRAAGAIRNRAMLDASPEPGLVIGFHDDLYGRSKGTIDCMTEAARRDLTVWHVDSHDPWATPRSFRRPEPRLF